MKESTTIIRGECGWDELSRTVEAERRSPTSKISGERFDRISIPAQAQIRELMSRLPRLPGSVILVALYLLGPLVSSQSANANDVSVAQGQKDLGSVLEIHGNLTCHFMYASALESGGTAGGAHLLSEREPAALTSVGAHSGLGKLSGQV